jgi:predicted MPP superfamily phosphohydrolase
LVLVLKFYRYNIATDDEVITAKFKKKKLTFIAFLHYILFLQHVWCIYKQNKKVIKNWNEREGEDSTRIYMQSKRYWCFDRCNDSTVK